MRQSIARVSIAIVGCLGIAACNLSTRSTQVERETPALVSVAPTADSFSSDTPPVITFTIPVAPPSVQTTAVTREVTKDDKLLLSAIAQVESTGDSRKVGRLGERGLYQFRSRVWSQYTKRSFWKAHDPKISTEIALQHCDWIRRQLVSAGFRGTSFEIALAWNAGLTSVAQGRIKAATYDYAYRVNNIYATL